MSTAIAIKEHPVLFRGPQVRGVLDGRTTQKRLALIPTNSLLDGSPVVGKHWRGLKFEGARVAGRGTPFLRVPCGWTGHPRSAGIEHRVDSRIEPGDHLWVREAFVIENTREYWPDADMPSDDRPIQMVENDRDGEYALIPRYRATEPDVSIVRADRDAEGFERTEWAPSIFMPRWACRITLEVVSVRPERLRLIGEADCENELGAAISSLGNGAYAAYREDWNGLHANRELPFDSDPWVWVVEFKRVEPVNNL